MTKKINRKIVFFSIISLAVLDVLLNTQNLVPIIGAISETATEITIEAISAVLLFYGLLKK